LVKQKSIKKRLRNVGERMKAQQAPNAGGQLVTSNEDASSLKKKWEKVRPKFVRAMERACTALGIDPDNERDRKFLLIVLVIAVFGGRGPGQPKRWPKKKLVRLRKDVEDIGKRFPDAKSELKRCELLVKLKRDYPMYEDYNPRTLVRALQNAKRSHGSRHLPSHAEVQQLAQAMIQK
jgi:hypothetical protein